MSTKYYLVPNRPSISSGILIGQSSFGWKFLFYKPSIWTVDQPLGTFTQWREFLKETVVVKESHVIMTEYDEIIPYEKFMKLIEEKQKVENKDNFIYCENVDGYRFTTENFG